MREGINDLILALAAPLTRWRLSRPSGLPISALTRLALITGFAALMVLTVRASSSVSIAPQASELDVVISEVAWMGTDASPNDEWLELYNTTSSSIDLTGWSLAASDATPSVTLAGTIPPRGYFLLERTDDSTVPSVAADQVYGGGLGNDGEDLTLQDSSSNVIDRIDCSPGWFAGHADARVPMVRVHITATGTISTNWTYNPRCGTATNSSGISRTCTLTVTHVGRAFDYAVAFNERMTTAAHTTTEETSLERSLLDLIENAAASIDVALYGLDRQRVVDALIAADARGVTVRVVGDDDAASGPYSTSYQQLADAGIPILTDSSGSIQHNKFAVVDGQVVWTGSTNLTDTGFTLNANNALVVTDTTMAAVYQTEFDEMWGGSFHRDKSDNTVHLFDYDGTLVESYFSPTDLVAFEVWDELERADETIHFAMFFWTDDLLTDRVLERMDDGVRVYGVWDELGAASPYSADDDLRADGAHITIENFAGKVHHKFAVIDVEGNDPTVILGSYNWTDGGAYQNDENTLIVHDRELARAYYKEWERLSTPFSVHLPLVMSQLEPTPETSDDIVITDIFYDGVGHQEPDEYVEIRNDDSTPIQLSGWTLRDDANHVFTFPSQVMEPGQVCRVYTHEHHPEWCGFSYDSGSAIWNNSGDCGHLYNTSGAEVSTYCY
jgi:phosphatidylserine/phosphatidylglycerophosphate/cardiolipin synthase-like enzyme